MMLSFGRSGGIDIGFIGIIGINCVKVMAPFRDVAAQIIQPQIVGLEFSGRGWPRVAVIVSLDICRQKTLGGIIGIIAGWCRRRKPVSPWVFEYGLIFCEAGAIFPFSFGGQSISKSEAKRS